MLLDGFFELPHSLKYAAQVVVCLGIVRIQPERLAKVSNGLSQIRRGALQLWCREIVVAQPAARVSLEGGFVQCSSSSTYSRL